MRYIDNAEAVLKMALKERRRWFHAYSFHLAFDQDALQNIISIQQAYEAAKAALAEERELAGEHSVACKSDRLESAS
ncbi:hypothetical protein V1281_000324 [Nitrobacteraceae bacterium AZCC 2161]